MDEPQVMGNPFAALLVAPPARLPMTRSATVVVAGKVLPKARPLSKAERASMLSEPEDAAERLAVERELQAARRVHQRARFQRLKASPEALARRQAYEERTKAVKAASQLRWEDRNKERRRAYKAEWARRARLLNPDRAEADREKARAYGRENRARIRARKRAMPPELKAIELEKRRLYRAANRERINAQQRASKERVKARKAAAEGGAA